MENGDVDHVKWLRRKAARLEAKAGGPIPLKRHSRLVNRARRLRDVAGALESALVGKGRVMELDEAVGEDVTVTVETAFGIVMTQESVLLLRQLVDEVRGLREEVAGLRVGMTPRKIIMSGTTGIDPAWVEMVKREMGWG